MTFRSGCSGGELAHGNIDRGVIGARRDAAEAGPTQRLDQCQRGDRYELWVSSGIADEASVKRKRTGCCEGGTIELQDDSG